MKKHAKQWLKSRVARYLETREGAQASLPPEHWGLAYRDGDLCHGTVPLAQLLERWPSPLHVVLEDRLLANLQSLQTAGRGPGQGCDVFYSYKTNPVPWILRFLDQQGVGAEVISEYELWLALKLGVQPERIIYNGPAKSDASLEWAVERGIRAININHWDEVSRLVAIARRTGRKANVGLRVTGSGWAGQFGYSMDDGSALEILGRLLEVPELTVRAIHCHRGVLIRSAEDLDGHLTKVLTFLEQVQQRHAWLPELLDIGGSLAVSSVRGFTPTEKRLGWSLNHVPGAPDPQATIGLDAYAARAVDTVKAWYAARRQPLPQLVIEPGRALTGNCQALLCTVLDIKKGREIDYAILDAGSSIARIVADEYHQVLPLRQSAAAPRTYRLVGPICHTGDIIYRAWRGPELRRGDRLAIMDSGAYFIPDASSFSFGRPAIARIGGEGDASLIRQAESHDHLISLDLI